MIKLRIAVFILFSHIIICNGQNPGNNLLCNGDFEDSTVVNPANFVLVKQSNVPCWKTTEADSIIEVWGNGFLGVPSYSGNQFIEINAYLPSTIYQNLQAFPGSSVQISFAHRGRDGVDVMSVSIGPVNGPYITLDTITSGNTAWTFHTINYTFPNNGPNTYSLRFNSVSAAGNNPAIGNLLDAISVIPNSPGIINTYSPILALDACTNKLTVEDASTFNAGDTVLLIQMKGAVIDSSNTSVFGTITDYKSSGNYEFNYAKSKTGNIIELKNKLTRLYDIPGGKLQLVRVPYHQNLDVTSTLTCLPWDGRKGGILVLNVRDTITLNADIDVSGKGFKGGAAYSSAQYQCDIDSFYIIGANGKDGSGKGEGIFLNTRLLNGRGKAANGGGGGNSVNSGGAGGGNGGQGGEGGKEWAGCNTNFINGGIGGSYLNYNNALNTIYLGGGGGAGHMNDFQLPGGGNGGGIAIIKTNYLKSNSYKIKSDGETPIHVVGPADDGRSGGGAGGTILINYVNLVDATTVSVNGGNGDYCIAVPDFYHGPGGGGAGGIIWLNKPVNDPLLITTISGGTPGTNINIGNNAWGATQGQNGSTLFNLSIPVANIPFVPGAISSFLTTTICQGQNYSGYTTSGTYIDTLISIYGCDSIRTLILTVKPKSYAAIAQIICSGQTYSGYSTSGTYIDTLVAANGCDSIRIINLTVKPGAFSAISQSICPGQTYLGHSTGGTYIDTLVAANGCDSIRTLHLAVLPESSPYLGADTSLCAGDSLQLYPGQFISYTWQDGSAQSHLTIKQPGLYAVMVTDNCGSASDEILVKEGICDIYFPSAFTPNNDGKNDWFKALGADHLSDYHLAVYDRWGQKVFETWDYTKGWAGKLNGQLLDTGVFIWYCEFKKPGNTNIIKMKGTLTLIR